LYDQPEDTSSVPGDDAMGRLAAMNAMILAAGRGTRLGALGRSTPKILVEVDGEPLLARQIRYLRQGGVERIVLNAHHLAEHVERFVAEHPQGDKIEVLFEPQLLGTAGGVCNALSLLGGESFLVLYGDVLFDEPIEAIYETHRRIGGPATITVYAAKEIEGKGTVSVSPDQTVTAFEEKTAARAVGEAYVNAGLYVMHPRFLAGISAGVPVDFGHDVFPAALARGERIGAHVLPAPVIDIGTPAALDLARSTLS
jgi:NDP-sugar pyrophosphorylase family protein